MPRLLHCLLPAIVSAGITGATAPGLGSVPDMATERFIERVNAYMEFRSDFVEMVPPLSASSDPRAIVTASNALAAALRAARPEARIGDVFAPDIVVAFRQRIGDAIRQEGCAAEALLAEINSEAPSASAPLSVNDRFDWARGAAMPGFLIAALPALPPELQYRFVGGDLVLVDIPARFIVDIMPLALAVN